MVHFIGVWETYPCVLTVSDNLWKPIQLDGGRWAATNGDKYVGSYLRMDLAQGACDRRNNKRQGMYVTYDKRQEKWLANIPGEGYYGRYVNRDDAVEAIRLRRNIAAERKASAPQVPNRVLPQRLALGGHYRVTVRRVHYGTYETPGHAVMVRDFVSHMFGLPKWFPDYLMPLALVTNPNAAALIDTTVQPETAAQIETYTRLVDEVNATAGIVRTAPASPPRDTDDDIVRVADMTPDFN